MCEVFLPPTHPYTKFVKDFVKSWTEFGPVWKYVETTKSDEQGGKDIMALYYMGIRMDLYWEKVSWNDRSAMVPQANELITKIEINELWEPRMSQGFRMSIKFSSCCRLFSQGGTGGTPSETNDVTRRLDAVLSELASFRRQGGAGAGGGQSSGGGAGRGSGAGAGGGGGAPSGASPSTAIRNSQYNEALFGVYRDRRVNGQGITCKYLKSKIAQNELPRLPKSKVDAEVDMCLPWHTKGVCGENCRSRVDHVHYTDAEYRITDGLAEWCSNNWPREDSPSEE